MNKTMRVALLLTVALAAFLLGRHQGVRYPQREEAEE